MGVLMTKAKADALASTERDRHLLSDKAALERATSQDAVKPSRAEAEAWDRQRQKTGR